MKGVARNTRSLDERTRKGTAHAETSRVMAGRRTGFKMAAASSLIRAAQRLWITIAKRWDTNRQVREAELCEGGRLALS